MRQHFNTVASTMPATYLAASLSFLTADTRQGLGEGARADLAVIKGRVSDPRVAAYVEKVEASLRKPLSPAQPSLRL